MAGRVEPGDPATLARLITEIGLDADAVMALGAEPRWTERREADTRRRWTRGVFGAPSYVIGDDIFWGQDRLEFVGRKLAAGAYSGDVDKSAGICPKPARFLYDIYVTTACLHGRICGVDVAK